MPDLRDRLRDALKQPVRRAEPAPLAGVTTRESLATLGGRWFETPDGYGYVIESVYEAGHMHGAMPLYRALDLDAGHLAAQAREPRVADVAPSDFLYIDTETTGLGGAGVMVFLCGAARFEGSNLILRQYLLPSPEYEVGLLGGIAGDIARAGALVSYNGKSFDLPVLETRYILSRQRPTLRSKPHVDLLHPNRRIFKGSYDSLKLVELETQVLAFERESDCPSWEVPSRYFAFQRTGDPTHIRPVLRHNAWDILTLVALTAHLADICDGQGEPLQAARAAGYAGDHETAALRYEEAARSERRAERLEGLENAARAWKKLGRHEDAARCWQLLIDEPRSRRLVPYVELAKHHEHRTRDLAAAYTVISTAVGMVRSGALRPGPATSETGLQAMEKRLARLERRLTRRAAGASQ